MSAAVASQNFQIVYDLQMLPNDNKEMEIMIADFNLQAEAGPLLALSNLAMMDEMTSKPIPPVFKEILTAEEAEILEKKKLEIEQFKK